jgi:rhodanese-related sulfurtransferase
MTSTVNRVDANTVIDWLRDPDKITVIDVRTPAEFETVHIDGSYNVPLDVVGDHPAKLASRLDRDCVLVCASGVRSADAQQRLAGVGAGNLHILEGGINAYEKAGGPVVRGQARWALERQVRLVAGSLVLTGMLAGLRFPKARLLSAGIGAGLTFSALSNTCAMGAALSKLPYNRGPRNKSATEVIEALPAHGKAA